MSAFFHDRRPTLHHLSVDLEIAESISGTVRALALRDLDRLLRVLNLLRCHLDRGKV